MSRGRKIAIAVVELVIYLLFLNFAMMIYDYIEKERTLSFPITFIPRTLLWQAYFAVNLVAVTLWALTFLKAYLHEV